MYRLGQGLAHLLTAAKAALTPSPVRSHANVHSAARATCSAMMIRWQAPTGEQKSCRCRDPNQGTRARLDLNSAGAGGSPEIVVGNSGGNALRTVQRD